MADIIKLLPDSVANQIAAGEVIQRPASVVKELMENAVDAGSTSVMVVIREAGKSLVQVIDNGCGMSETDARLAFERHATSKIRDASDLFAIRTMGFRGEALASIAAISQLELKTRLVGEELGTTIQIHGSEVVSQEPVSSPQGTHISVKNLFYNIPVRRKFLKSLTTEFKHIVTEFQRVSLAHPGIEFSLHHNDQEVYRLSPSNRRQRIIALFGKPMNQNLLQLDGETSIVSLSGFVGKPEHARKTFGEQFFFVNNRYMRHPYFHRAVMNAYEQILPADAIPSYFIYLETDPENIDINIHPTKTEVKFEDERAIWQILNATTRESLGRHNVVPSLDFDQEGAPDIPVFRQVDSVHPPSIELNPEFNPFEKERKTNTPEDFRRKSVRHWEKIYEGLETDQAGIEELSSEGKALFPPEQIFFQLKNRYILTTVKSGLLVISQRRAHERIIYEKYIQALDGKGGDSQQVLYPVNIQLDPADHSLLMEIRPEIEKLGLSIDDLGNHSIMVNGMPPAMEVEDPVIMVEQLLEAYKKSEQDPSKSYQEKIAASLAASSAIRSGTVMTGLEMRKLVDELFGCKSPNYGPDGKGIFTIIDMDQLEKLIR
jgi:DNA mismatch repair protein MutL